MIEFSDLLSWLFAYDWSGDKSVPWRRIGRLGAKVKLPWLPGLNTRVVWRVPGQHGASRSFQNTWDEAWIGLAHLAASTQSIWIDMNRHPSYGSYAQKAPTRLYCPDVKIGCSILLFLNELQGIVSQNTVISQAMTRANLSLGALMVKHNRHPCSQMLISLIIYWRQATWCVGYLNAIKTNWSAESLNRHIEPEAHDFR